MLTVGLFYAHMVAIETEGIEMNFSTPITTIEEAKTFIENLHAADMLFHFEDSPSQIGHTENGKWVSLWTAEEAELVSQRRDELYDLDWSVIGHECPIGYALEVMDRA